VIQKINHYRKELGVGVCLTGSGIGSMPHHLARKGLQMFSREVLPHVRDEAPTV